MIRGLVVNRFATGIGVDVNSVGNRIEGNFVGTDPSGTLAEGNQFNGVFIIGGASQNVVGGSTPDKRNVISGNGSGIRLNSDDNRIEGNYVGTDKSGTQDLGNTGHGVLVDRVSGNTVGGTTAGARNVISGNDGNGVEIDNATDNKVLGNRIGTTANGTGALGNSEGVFINGATNNVVGNGTAGGSNTIAFNFDGVVTVATSTGNEISRNSIYSNAALGIDLNNDAGDADSGPNNLQNRPAITSAKTASGLTTINGKLSSAPGVTYKLQFFSNPGGADEGKKFIGQKTITTDATSGERLFTFKPAGKVAVGRTITATATRDTTGDPTHDTSEFSAPRTVASS